MSTGMSDYNFICIIYYYMKIYVIIKRMEGNKRDCVCDRFPLNEMQL